MVKRLSDGIAKALAMPDVIQKLGHEATLPLLMNPAETKAYIESEVIKFMQLAKEASIQPE